LSKEGKLAHEIDTKHNGVYAFSPQNEIERLRTRELMKKALKEHKNK